MNVLKKKLKKVNIFKKILYILTIIIYLVSYGYFVYGLLELKKIETIIRIILIAFFGVWIIIYMLSALIKMVTKKTWSFIFISFFTLLFTPAFIFSSYIIEDVMGALNRMNKEEVTYRSNLIALKGTKLTRSSILGMVNSEDDLEGVELAKELIKRDNLSDNELKKYDDYPEMIKDLLDKKIDACFVGANYEVIEFEDEDENDENNIDILEVTEVLSFYDKTLLNQDSKALISSKQKELTEPFTVLIMGVDSAKNGLKANQSFNGDTLILVTFNPSNLTATMFSLPRDLYVPIACRYNRYGKINSSAASGSKCVMNTIKNLTDIDIDYYVKMNFVGVIDLVNALGGVTVDVKEPDFTYNGTHYCGEHTICESGASRHFGNDTFFVKAGKQNLNGKQALAYARNRHQFRLSDIARNQHQQQIIEAIAQKVKKIRTLNDFQKILDAISNNVETNMTPDQMLSFYSVGKDMLLNSNSDSTALSIKKTYLTYYNLNVSRGGDYKTSALGYWQSSLDEIINAMKENLGLKEQKPIKTFSISYNEDYKTPLIGASSYSGTKLELMPNLVGNVKSYTESWCSSRGKNCSFEFVDSSLPYGTIVTQSAHEAMLVIDLGTITFTVSNGTIKDNPVTPVTPEEPEEENPEPQEEDTPSKPEEPSEPEVPEEENKPEENNNEGTE